MPYYTGDYYRGDNYCRSQRGDYYRGDFLGIGKLVKKVGTAVARVVGSVVPGPIGMIARAIAPPAGAGGRVTFFPPEPSIPNPLLPAQPFIQPGLPVSGGGGMVMDARTGQLCTLKGTRLNKSTYITRGGGTSRWPQEIIVHPKGTECVKPRRLNVANPRALRRALRRAAGFVKLARRAHVRLASFTGRGKTAKRKR